VTVTQIRPSVPTARRGTVVLPTRPYADPGVPADPTPAHDCAPVAALRLPGHVLRAVAPLLEDAGFEVLDITTHERGPRPQLVVLELPDDEATGRRLLAPPPSGPGRLFLAAGDVPAWATLQWAADEIVRSPFHRLQVVAAALRVGRLPAEAISRWADHAFDDVLPSRPVRGRDASRCA
jgi:hypothetical protein